MSAPDAASASQGTTIITHKVEKGETIYGIATQYGLSTQEVMEQNPIVSDGLKAGQTLHLTIPAKNTPATPAAHVSAVPAQAPVASTPDEGYIVKKMETFYSIANAHGITVAQLKAANPGITSLKEGQV
ncbi:MAG: LysM peptidoglycan-binding domain-containing protein, partial [Duncaniella sp.]|nr:LysM peptidoglycan-binding domain-containing protein [Duncaniella sp.]